MIWQNKTIRYFQKEIQKGGETNEKKTVIGTALYDNGGISYSMRWGEEQCIICFYGGRNREDRRGKCRGFRSKENSGYFYDGEGYKAVLVYVVGADAPDQDRISEAFNELTKKELNMEVELMPMTLGTWISQVPMMLAGNEQIDLMPMWASSAATYIASDYIEDLTPYLENEEGQYFKEQLGDEALNCCKIGDFTYGIPVQKERAMVNAFVCRKDVWMRQELILLRSKIMKI